MATYDLSRWSTDLRKRYTGVRMQQGRVLMDDDWNENERLHDQEERAVNLDVIGAAGSPDQGFRISNPVSDAANSVDFTIQAGTYYLGGQRLELPASESYQRQADWLQKPGEENPGVPKDGQFDLAYLELWQQPVTAVEDAELLEPALGGPDTTVRMRTMHRVHVASNLGTEQCSQAWEKLRESWARQGRGTIGCAHQLVPDTQLTVDFVNQGNSADLCNPPMAGGYLGAENQAIRVQLVDDTHVTWGFDNAAPLYRVQMVADQGQKVFTMLTPPKDQAHWPLSGQIVEFLPWSAVLPNQEVVSEIQGFLARVDASYNPDSKQFSLIESLPDNFGEDWESRPDAATLRAFEHFRDGNQFFYVRVWNRGGDTTSDPAVPLHNQAVSLPGAHLPGPAAKTAARRQKQAVSLPEAAPPPPAAEAAASLQDQAASLLETRLQGLAGQLAFGQSVVLGGTGLRITLTGMDRVPGDFWIIAARPDTPRNVLPWRLTEKMPPQGIRRYYAPLAVIRWRVAAGKLTGKVVSDCRRTFRPLTQLRQCCTRIVGDGQTTFGDYDSIQGAIESLPSTGGKICILPGVYVENITITGRSNITLQGCGGRSRIQPASGKAAILIEDSQRILLKRLAVDVVNAGACVGIYLKETLAGQQKGGLDRILDQTLAKRRRGGLDHITLVDLHIDARDRTAIWGSGGTNVKILNNRIRIQQLQSTITADASLASNPAIFLQCDNLVIEDNIVATEVCSGRMHTAAGGVQVGGGSSGVQICGNEITGGNGNGLTLGSVHYYSVKELAGVKQLPWAARHDSYTSEDVRANLVRVSDSGCVRITPGDEPPTDGNGAPLIPISDGNVDQVLIAGNKMQNMGRNGVATVQVDSDDVLIGVEDLTLEGNWIRDCVRIQLDEKVKLSDNRAQGGVVLGEALQAVIRGNVIEENGPSHVDPICGIFILHAEGVTIEGNRIVDNGRRQNAEQTPRPGQRGGVVVGFAYPLPRDFAGEAVGLPPLGESALVIRANRIMAPEGRALKIIAMGAVAVEENQLVSFGAQGVDLSAFLRELTAAMDNRKRAGQSSGVAASAAELQADFLDLLGGAAVTIVNLGQTYELAFAKVTGFAGMQSMAAGSDRAAPQAAAETVKPKAQEAAKAKSAAPAATTQTESSTNLRAASHVAPVNLKESYLNGGNVLFHHNQVVLDLLYPGSVTPTSSVLLVSLDDIGMLGNQCDFVQVKQDNIGFFHALVAAFSVRATSNRFKEPFLFRAYSALTISLLNHTETNQGTHCIIAMAPKRLLPCKPNRSLWQLYSPTICSTGLLGSMAYPTTDPIPMPR